MSLLLLKLPCQFNFGSNNTLDPAAVHAPFVFVPSLVHVSNGLFYIQPIIFSTKVPGGQHATEKPSK